MQDFALPFVELLEVPVGPFLQPLKVLLVGRMTFCGVAAIPPTFVSSANLMGVYSGPSTRPSMKILNTTGPGIDPWDSYWLPDRQCTIDDYPLGSAIQAVF